LTVDVTSALLFLDKVPIFCYSLKGYYFEQITGLKKMIKLAIIFLPIVLALIWALFIGLRINSVETRDGKRKLINY
tara:strand:+ start:368 stop:595 length:228 start_codon:yes stop_codon:yes gene_type:complete